MPLMQEVRYDMVAILGATASGKTGVATHLAKKVSGEVISADSRQLYRGMDLGTGKDIEEYTIDGVEIPYHLIDIVDAGYRYNLFEYQRDFIEAHRGIVERKNFPILCGGSGMYIESILKGYRLAEAPKNNIRREELKNLTLEELQQILHRHVATPNSSDLETKRRCTRAIEIFEFGEESSSYDPYFPEINTLTVGIKFPRELRRERITTRLKQRIDEGMIEEVENLIASGIKPEDLIYYGLEYKYLTNYVTGEITKEEMFTQLNIAIHQFSKRQMTWFRKMERKGSDILWIDGTLDMEEKVSIITDKMQF